MNEKMDIQTKIEAELNLFRVLYLVLNDDNEQHMELAIGNLVFHELVETITDESLGQAKLSNRLIIAKTVAHGVALADIFRLKPSVLERAAAYFGSGWPLREAAFCVALEDLFGSL